MMNKTEIIIHVSDLSTEDAASLGGCCLAKVSVDSGETEYVFSNANGLARIVDQSLEQREGLCSISFMADEGDEQSLSIIKRFKLLIQKGSPNAR